MRSVLERDRLIEGDFTMFSAPLERTVLKKARLLGAVRPVQPQPHVAADVRQLDLPIEPPIPAVEAPAQPDGFLLPVETASPVSNRAVPPKPPAPRSTIFGDKLLEALRPPDKEN